ncbi:hypothetical protein ALC60_04773 [Trachymyrmex zeteki]|uniref:SAP domain-containing protein n=1 Tax=Mycetomoellerius zeteki TaxID=64791 RepID=A0A151X7L6_9HYME|nr:hypothetical protein ALC60_04773 [Trachymyrmex zeteki]
MDAFDFTNNQLRDVLKFLNLSISGTKAELVARLDTTLMQEKWFPIIQSRIAEVRFENPPNAIRISKALRLFRELPHRPLERTLVHKARSRSSEPELLARELEFMCRERELMQRELDLARRENEILRQTPRSEISGSVIRTSNITLKSIGDYLTEFHGTEDTFPVWEKEVRKLRTMYEIDDNSTKLLIGAKVKGKATWLHSKAEFIELDVESLLDEMKKMFGHRLDTRAET